MSVFLVTPVRESLADPAWALSWHIGPVEVAAGSTEEARRCAAGRYTMAMSPNAQTAGGRSPWLERDLVTVELIPAERGP